MENRRKTVEKTNSSWGNLEDNSLSFIRLIAALQVMLGHMIEHMELPTNGIALRIVYFLRGVPIFFVMSGFLIWFSIERSNSYSQYLRKRFWRIYPELWIAVIVEIITLIMLYHDWNYKDLSLFAITQSTIFQFWTPESLRGYGVGTPNGALWTICVIIQFYILAWLFHRLMKNRNLITWITGFVLSYVISISGQYVVHDVIKIELIEKLYEQIIIKYFWLFYFGMFIAKFKDLLLPIFTKLWYVFLLFAGIFCFTRFDISSGYYICWSLFLSSGLIGFAYRFPKLTVGIDISYEIFLYHMTVVNVFVYLAWKDNWVYVIPVTFITLILAYLSTITVGRFSYTRKQRVKEKYISLE